MEAFAEICDQIRHLSDPSDFASVRAISTRVGEAGRDVDPAAVADVLVMSFETLDASDRQQSHGAEERDGTRMVLWLLINRLCCDHDILASELTPRLPHFAEISAICRNSPHYKTFREILSGLKHVVDIPTLGIVALRAEERHRRLHGNQDVEDEKSSGSITKTSSRNALVSLAATSYGMFGAQRANNARIGEAATSLQVRSRDSLQAVTIAGLYAPALPAEVAVIMPQRDADAPVGHMRALPANHASQYRETRTKRLREVLEKRRQNSTNVAAIKQTSRKRQREEGENSIEERSVDTSEDEQVIAIDAESEVEMPLELPRDEFGLQKANYPAGVRFLRRAIAACGGVLPLSHIEQRLAMADSDEMRTQFGNVREFVELHRPTFALSVENEEVVVRLRNEHPGASGMLTAPGSNSLDHAVCALCSREVGHSRNMSRHVNSRRCVGIQMAGGMNGSQNGPISSLLAAATDLIRLTVEGGDSAIDDDDVEYLADCIEAAAQVRRFRFASERLFSPVLKAVRVVRDRWLREKGVSQMAEAPIVDTDRSVGRLFATLGTCMLRLPIAWIESGDIVDICARFTTNVLEPFLPPPRPADIRIRVNNEYPGMLFADSGTDSEEIVSSEGEMSDDEAPMYEFAPPVSSMEAIMVAGIPRDTRRLNYRLQTAPPMAAAAAIQAGSTARRTHASTYRLTQE